jgi:pilus assembly protein CpaB
VRRRILLIIIAALFALTGTAAIWRYVAGADARALAGKEVVTVLVAAEAIPAGAAFDDAHRQGKVATTNYPRAAVPTGTFTDPAQAAGLVASRAIEPHELLLATNFAPADTAGPATAGLAIPQGKVALPLSLKHFKNAVDWAGYLQPNAQIAIFEAFTSAERPGQPPTPRGDGLTLEPPNNQVARLLLDRVTVLAVAKDPSAEADAAGAAIVLAVDQKQSEKLILGLANGAVLYPVLLTRDQVLAPSPGTDNSHQFDTAGGSTP